jgi:predicted nucleic acid-binding protein
VSDALVRTFPASAFLDTDETLDLTARLADLGVSGGSIYDALVGASAAAAGLDLLTRDRRAAAVYRAVGADFRLIG